MDMKTLSLYNGLASRSDYGHTLGWAVLATGATVLTGMVVGRQTRVCRPTCVFPAGVTRVLTGDRFE